MPSLLTTVNPLRTKKIPARVALRHIPEERMSSEYIKKLQEAAKRRKEIVRLHKTMSITEIANVVGVSRQRVSEVLREEREKAK